MFDKLFYKGKELTPESIGKIRKIFLGIQEKIGLVMMKMGIITGMATPGRKGGWFVLYYRNKIVELPLNWFQTKK